MKLEPISDAHAEMYNGGSSPVRNEAAGKCMPEPSWRGLANNRNVGTPDFVLQFGCNNTDGPTG